MITIQTFSWTAIFVLNVMGGVLLAVLVALARAPVWALSLASVNLAVAAAIVLVWALRYWRLV